MFGIYESARKFLWRAYAEDAPTVSLLYGVLTILEGAAANSAAARGRVMLVDQNEQNTSKRLLDAVRLAPAVTPELVSEIIAKSCPRLHLLNSHGKAATRVERLIQSSAWLDLGLALIAVEQPGWLLRRVAYDDGEWHCSFSGQPSLPMEFDDTIDTHHEVLPLAILAALLEAQTNGAASATRSAAVPQVRPAPALIVCCDNFS